jgi:hypothetical protein
MTKRLLALALLVCLPVLLHAQLPQTFVSGTGNDANAGTRTAPCKTLAGALTKTSAGGLISIMDPGEYGTVTISKSVTIEGEASDVSILAAGLNGVVINALATDVVTLRNISLEGTGTGFSGIQIVQAGSVHIESCTINGFATAGVTFAPPNAGCQLYVKDTTIHKCPAVGITLTPTAAAATAHISNSHITKCGNGISAATGAVVCVDNTLCDSNSLAGFLTTAGTANMSLFRCTATGDLVGIQTSAKISLLECSVFNNTTGLKVVAPGVMTSFGNNTVSGNGVDGAPTAAAVPK